MPGNENIWFDRSLFWHRRRIISEVGFFSCWHIRTSFGFIKKKRESVSFLRIYLHRSRSAPLYIHVRLWHRPPIIWVSKNNHGSSNFGETVANFTKNKSPAAIIILCPKNWRWHSKTHVKKNIADWQIIAAGDLFLVKLASGLRFRSWKQKRRTLVKVSKMLW